MSTTVPKEDALNMIKAFLKTDTGLETATNLYTDYAGQYDECLTTLDYSGHKKVTECAFDILKDNLNARILDVGAGSGLVGLELQNKGFTDLDAVDPSQRFLDIAKARGIYKKAMCQFVGPDTPIPVDDDTYDMVVLSGVMNENHLPLSAMLELIRIIRPGGHIINTFRKEALQAPMYQGKFEEYFNNLEKEGKWKQVMRQEYSGFIINVPGLLLIHQIL